MTIDGTDPLDADDELSLVSLPATFVDGAGFAWTVDVNADLAGGAEPAIFWQAPIWYGTQAQEAVMRPGGRELFVQISPFFSRRKLFFPEDGAFIRILDIAENDYGFGYSSIEIYRFVQLASGAATEVVATSSGDLLAGVDDGFVVTDDGDGSGAPAVVQVFAGPGAIVPPLGAWWSLDLFQVYFQTSLPPHTRKILLTFLALADSRAEAIALANHLATLPPEALEGMDDAERADVVNFVVPPAAP